MTREKLLAKLQLCVDDPMWADHVEMPKQLLRVVIEQLGAPAQRAWPDLVTIYRVEDDEENLWVRVPGADIAHVKINSKIGRALLHLEADIRAHAHEATLISTERCDGADDLEHLDGMLDDRERG